MDWKARIKPYLKGLGITVREFEKVVKDIEAQLNEEEKNHLGLNWSGECLHCDLRYRRFYSPAWTFVSNVFHRQAEKKCKSEDSYHVLSVYCACELNEARRFIGEIKNYKFKPM